MQRSLLFSHGAAGAGFPCALQGERKRDCKTRANSCRGMQHTPLHNFAMREELSADAMTPTLMSHLHAYTQLVRGRYEGARSSMTGSVVANGAD